MLLTEEASFELQFFISNGNFANWNHLWVMNYDDGKRLKRNEMQLWWLTEKRESKFINLDFPHYDCDQPQTKAEIALSMEFHGREM